MTDKAPERIWVCPQYEEKAFHDFEFGGWPEYVRADLLEAAQARIAELEARLEIDHYFVVDGDDIENMKRVETTPDERRTFPDKITCLEAEIDLISEALATARAEALEEAAKEIEKLSGWPGCDYSIAIRALKGGSNG